MGQAIESALQQNEVVECVLVDDGSTDNSLEILREYAAKDERVKVYRHPDGINRGAGATRNLALQKTTAPYIAFLDSDDYWIENRFEKTRQIFENHPDAEGVYEARASHTWNGNPDSPDFSMLREHPEPNRVFFSLSPFGTKGIITLVGLTVKRSVLEKIGYFVPELRLAQDTDWVAKLSLKCKLYGGDLEKPVAIRRMHSHNATRNVELHKVMRVKMSWSVLQWAVKEKMPAEVIHLILKTLLKYHYENNNLSSKSSMTKKKNDIRFLIQLWKLKPSLFQFKELKYFRNLALHIPTTRHVEFYE